MAPSPTRVFLSLLLAIAAAFGGALWAPFQYDDHALVEDRAITAPDGWKDVWRFTQTRPLTWFSFRLNYQMAGAAPWSWHGVNVALHGLASCLLFVCLGRLIPRDAALIAAAAFAVHPIQTEAVVYVFARATLLAAVLSLASLAAWTSGRHWLAVAWFGAALLAKEECAAFPVFLALLHVSISRNRAERAPIGAMLLLAIAAVARVAFLTAVTPGSGAGPQAGIGPWEYFLTQGTVLFRYARFLVLPVGLSVDPAIERASVGLGLAAWAAIGLAGFVALRRFDKAREGMWFLGAVALIAPTSSLFPAQDLAADRRLYLPMTALAPMAALLCYRTRYKVLLVACGIVFTMLGYARTAVWQSEAGLWEDALRQAPGKVRPRLQLARVSESQRALELLDEARVLAPENAEVAAETGRVHAAAGRWSEALEEFSRALAIRPGDANLRNNRGVALAALGFPDRAADDFRAALAVNRCHAGARENLGKLGQPPPPAPQCR